MESVGEFSGFFLVDLVQSDEKRFFKKGRVVGCELPSEHKKLFEGIPFLMRGEFDDEKENRGPFDVLQKGDSESPVLGGFIDEAWNVGNEEF